MGSSSESRRHHSSVFTFTHVDVVDLPVLIDGGKDKGGQTEDWKIETDSGNVLELVTSPIVFKTAADAYTAKKRLAGVMTASVSPAKISPNVLNAVTFGEWVPAVGPLLAQSLRPVTPDTSR